MGTQRVINYNFLLKNKQIHLKNFNCSIVFFFQPLTITNTEAFFNPFTTNYFFRLSYWFCCVVICSRLFGLIKLQQQKPNTANIWHVARCDKPSQWTLSLHLFVNVAVELMQLKNALDLQVYNSPLGEANHVYLVTNEHKWAHVPCVMVDTVSASWWTEMVRLCKQQLCLEWLG